MAIDSPNRSEADPLSSLFCDGKAPRRFKLSCCAIDSHEILNALNSPDAIWQAFGGRGEARCWPQFLHGFFRTGGGCGAGVVIHGQGGGNPTHLVDVDLRQGRAQWRQLGTQRHEPLIRWIENRQGEGSEDRRDGREVAFKKKEEEG